MKNSEELREEFLSLLKQEFPTVRIKETRLKSGNLRLSLYVPNNKNNKRWMQLDANPKYLSIAMDHSYGDIKTEDIEKLHLSIGLNSSLSAIKISNNNAVIFSIFCSDPYNFSNLEFVQFLHKHYQSYLKLVN